MLDRCGKEIKKGAVVDMLIDGITACYVLDVIEPGAVADVHGRVTPGKLVLNIATSLKIAPGVAAPVYVVREPDAKGDDDAEVKDADLRT